MKKKCKLCKLEQLYTLLYLLKGIISINNYKCIHYESKEAF